MSDLLVVYQNPQRRHSVSKSAVEHEAREAARRGLSLNDSCPYPFGSEAGAFFKAAWLAAQCAGTAPAPDSTPT